MSINKEHLKSILSHKVKFPSEISLDLKDLILGLLKTDPTLRLGSKEDAAEVK